MGHNAEARAQLTTGAPMSMALAPTVRRTAFISESKPRQQKSFFVFSHKISKIVNGKS